MKKLQMFNYGILNVSTLRITVQPNNVTVIFHILKGKMLSLCDMSMLNKNVTYFSRYPLIKY